MTAEHKTQTIQVRMDASQVAAIDEWRRHEADIPGRSEAIRRLIEAGLKAAEQQPAQS